MSTSAVPPSPSVSDSTAQPSPTPTPAAVAQFLHDNPEFLIHQPALLAQLELPRQESSGAISLAQRQTQVLRDRIRLLESRLTEMMHVGEENDAIVKKMTSWSVWRYSPRGSPKGFLCRLWRWRSGAEWQRYGFPADSCPLRWSSVRTMTRSPLWPVPLFDRSACRPTPTRHDSHLV
jgi:hypothetical protein